MSTDERASDTLAPAYRTGVAARLAGIPVETLRVWERRYHIVGPRLSPRGHRLYSAADVSRLVLIRQLVDLGSPIGSIAGLPPRHCATCGLRRPQRRKACPLERMRR